MDNFISVLQDTYTKQPTEKWKKPATFSSSLFLLDWTLVQQNHWTMTCWLYSHKTSGFVCVFCVYVDYNQYVIVVKICELLLANFRKIVMILLLLIEKTLVEKITVNIFKYTLQSFSVYAYILWIYFHVPTIHLHYLC